MSKTNPNFDKRQRVRLLEHAKSVILEFQNGLIKEGDSDPFGPGKYGSNYFSGFMVRFTKGYIEASREFTRLASKMLKARNAHEKTILTMCKKAGQDFVKLVVASERETLRELDKGAEALVQLVLAEAGREYIHLQPNFLVKLARQDVVNIGRVRSMSTQEAAVSLALPDRANVNLIVSNEIDQDEGWKPNTVHMPRSVWVVEVPATKENVVEEAKWLIDVAVSLMRLSADWNGNCPHIGEIEAHPIYPKMSSHSHLTIDNEDIFVKAMREPSRYVASPSVVSDLNKAYIQERAKILFDPAENSLAKRVAQGLGWMTRGRQASDRAERLLSFFTALEALLSSDDKSAPVTQTISRYTSVICSQEIIERHSVYKVMRGLYNLRSDVVHKGQRGVLWQEVNDLQVYVEQVYETVLDQCDLSLKQEQFEKSLADASHGMPWEFATSLADQTSLGMTD